MFPRSPKTDPARLEAVRAIKDWTRERFALGDEAAVMVSEVRCSLPGCPPLETVVAFWTGPERRYAFKVFKPVEGVAADDLPPRFMREALIDDGQDAACC